MSGWDWLGYICGCRGFGRCLGLGAEVRGLWVVVGLLVLKAGLAEAEDLGRWVRVLLEARRLATSSRGLGCERIFRRLFLLCPSLPHPQIFVAELETVGTLGPCEAPRIGSMCSASFRQWSLSQLSIQLREESGLDIQWRAVVHPSTL